jgi:hypothetical protein
MGISVPACQQELEKKHAGCPYRRSPAKPRQNEFADDKLNLEQQECAEEYCRKIKTHVTANPVITATIASEPAFPPLLTRSPISPKAPANDSL